MAECFSRLVPNGECINRKGSEPLSYQVTPNLIIFSGLRKPLQPLWIIHCVMWRYLFVVLFYYKFYQK